MADPEEGVVTDLMLGTMIVFGADIIIFVGIAWITDFVSATLFVAVTTLIISIYAVRISWRWRELKQFESSERSPVEELKYRDATGKISEEEFEQKLEAVMSNLPFEYITHENIDPSTEKSEYN